MTIMVICWNTMKLEEFYAWLKANSQKIDDTLLRHIGLVQFGNINMRGTMSFRVKRYAGILIKACTTSNKKAG